MKKGKNDLFGLHQLADLCQDARSPGLVAADFVKREQSGSAYSFVASCFPLGTPDSIVAALQRLVIEDMGNEERLRKQAVAHLDDLFRNAEELVTQLHNWFLQHPDGTISVDIKLLYSQVVSRYGRRDPARPRWIHLTRDAVMQRWEARGPLSLEDLVECSWGSAESVRLQIGAKPFSNESASSCLSRLLLHRSPSGTTETDPAHQWQAHTLGLCSGTLGTTTESPAITYSPLECASPHLPQEEMTEKELSALLSRKMNDYLWRSYVDVVSRHLSEDEIGEDLRPGMQAIWAAWNTKLAGVASHRESFVRAMVATAEEWGRKGFDARVRAGRHLIENLACATVTTLAIGAALAARGIQIEVGPEGALENLHLGPVSAHVIALTVASHPHYRKPWRLSDAPGAMFLAESGLAILGTVDASASDLYRLACQEALPFHASDAALQNYRHSGSPFPILTAGPIFRHALRSGLVAMQEHLAEVLGQMNDDRLKGLKSAVEGAPGNV